MDTQRRKFLKTILLVGGFFIVQKLVPPALLKAQALREPRDPRRKTTGGAFKVIEGGKKVSVRDESGEEIFQIDNEE